MWTADDVMKSLWGRYRRLSKVERLDLMLGFAVIPAAAGIVRLFGGRRWKAVTGQDPEAGAESAGIDAARIRGARTTARMIEAASRHGIVRGNCLSKSIALRWLLRRKGIHAPLRIGARKAGNGLEAHAWVELDGQIINDSEEVRESYTIFEGRMTRQFAARK